MSEGPVSLAFAGGIAGVCLWTAIFPADVVKSRVQVSIMSVISKLKFHNNFS